MQDYLYLEDLLMKKCTICGNILPNTNENFYKHPSYSDGLSPYCKNCTKEKSKKRNKEKSEYIKEHNKINKYGKRGVKPPFNYFGNKYYSYQEIKKYFPEKIDIFYDLFCGSGMVGCNSDASKIILNDIDNNMINTLKKLKKEESFLEQCININTKEDYEIALNEFNKTNDVYLFYSIIQHSYMQNPIYKNNILVNNFADGKCYLNLDLKNRIKEFYNLIKNKDIDFLSKDFSYFKNFNQTDFVYIDPPYLNTKANYNSVWKEEDEERLYAYLKNLNCKWAASNTRLNNKIVDWALMNNFNIIDIKKTKYKTQNKTKNKSEEILIMNY